MPELSARLPFGGAKVSATKRIVEGGGHDLESGKDDRHLHRAWRALALSGLVPKAMTATISPTLPQSIALAWQLLQQGRHAAADDIVRPLLLAGAMGDELVPLIGAIRLQQ